MPRVLFRVDAGRGIGLGHLQRSLSLAAALHRGGATCFFQIFGDAAAAARAERDGFAAELLDAEPSSPDDLEAMAAAARTWSCDVAVVDSYLVTASYLAGLRERGLYVVALDDLNEEPFPCQMVVSHGPHAPSAGYASSSGDTRFLLGPSYAILRPEFWDAPPPAVRPSTGNVLVTTGGADPAGVMPSWLRCVDSLQGAFAITAVLGPFFTNAEDVHRAAGECRRTVRVIEAPPVMRPLLAAADVALTAGGQTIYELAAIGVPAVAVEIAANQAPQLAGFASAGTMLVPGAASEAGILDRIAVAVSSLVSSRDERARLSAAGRATVNARGALAVAREIAAAAPA